MKDRLLTIAASVAATLALTHVFPELVGRANSAPHTNNLLYAAPAEPKTLTVDRLIVRKELIVSDTGQPWEKGFEDHQVARGLYARSLYDGPGGLWVRSRLIKTEIDDPFDDRFHALERDGSLRGSPGHISWNTWLDGHWRQMAIIQGEGLELFEVPRDQWNGLTHPGRLRFQTFRPRHGEPLTDCIIGQGMMSLGGGGYGGGGLPYPSEVLQLWGGTLTQHPLSAPTRSQLSTLPPSPSGSQPSTLNSQLFPIPSPPTIARDDSSGPHTYVLIAVGPQGHRSAPSRPTAARGLATLQWDSLPGADSYLILRDGQQITPTPIRLEGSQKTWTDPGAK